MHIEQQAWDSFLLLVLIGVSALVLPPLANTNSDFFFSLPKLLSHFQLGAVGLSSPKGRGIPLGCHSLCGLLWGTPTGHCLGMYLLASF